MFCFRSKTKSTIKPEFVPTIRVGSVIQLWENKEIIKKVVVGNPMRIKIHK
jgi:hypothetical protein